MQSDFSTVVSGIEELVQRHRNGRLAFSAWQSHCLRSALFCLRVGRYERADRYMQDALNPPSTPPIFPYPGPITVEELERAVSHFSTGPAMASSPGQAWHDRAAD